ncbi:MAG TPA: L,D-transpeptidase [Ottowia sp.]|uniref:L,D-transpeptidase n=1 Tax=Ottowia sp. TaxID=1898956 RepID=UPI002C25D27D|nr:L,D-transpeptidase [Ottowia sp.]HMN20158.1 L,D-transpeptidase [Ottowia sp.]
MPRSAPILACPLARPLAAVAVGLALTLGASAAQPLAEPPPPIARFAAAVHHSGDAQGRAFAVLDKPAAHLWVFDRQGRLLGEAPVLLGAARGDTAPADIGSRPLAHVLPHEKITSAGRYPTEPGRNTRGEDIVWLDYDAALSMHRVRDVPGEERPARLSTPSAADNRISFGCINLPPAFYERTIAPLFRRRSGIVYVLPETRAIEQVFPFARGIALPPS